MVATIDETTAASPTLNWSSLADRVLEGYSLTADEALAVLRADDDELLEIMAAAFKIRRRWFGKTVQLYFLMNAKSGLCPEDCHYCSQSKDSTAEISKYNLLSRDKLLDGARMAAERGSKTYCIVISARGPSEREIQAVEFYEQVCTTHTFQDRVDTLTAVRAAGLALCSGGIIGMGERDEDVVQMALSLRELNVESIPLNFLIDIEGTPLARSQRLTPRYCLKALAMFRFVNPQSELRIAGGRELHLGSLQALGLYAANSIFVGDYLTTKGQPPEADYRMIEEMGFVVTRHEEVPAGHS